MTDSERFSEARQKFEQDGYVIFDHVIDNDLIHETRQHVDWLIRKYPNLRPEQLNTQLVRHDPFWLRLLSDDRLLDIAEQFIGPDIALFASHYICKPPFDGHPVLWHQDGSYWPLEPMNVISLWLAVDDSDEENGCLRVIPGSHKLELQKMKRRSDIKNVLESEIDSRFVDESKAVNLILKAGGVSIHHPNIVHGSKANYSSRRRCGLTIRYIPTTTRIISEKQWASSFLLRGKAVPGVNDYLSKPKYIAGEHMPFHGSEKWK